MTVSPPTLFWYQLTVGTLGPTYWGQLDTCVRSLCTENSITPPTAPWYSTIVGTLNSAWILQIDTAVRSLCTALSVTPPSGTPVNLIPGTQTPNYYASLDACVRNLCAASGSYAGPLDLVSGATLAFSPARALRAAWIGQNVIRLRRDSDNAELDFVAGADGSVSVAAVTTWLAGANGFAVTVYDQSGNGYNVTQATTTQQPAWIANSTNNRPGLRYDGSKRMSGADTITFSSGAYTTFGVEKYTRGAGSAVSCIGGIADPTGGVAYAIMAIDLNAGAYKTRAEAEDNASGFQRIFSTSSALLFNQFAVVDSALSLDVHSAFINNADVSGTTAISDAIATFTGKAGFGSEGTGNFDLFQGDICEFLFYPSIISLPNRALVRPNEATYYGVTLS